MYALSQVIGVRYVDFARLRGIRWAAALSLFVAMAVGLPYACHQFGIAGKVFLPMHLAVFLAALTAGPRAGFATALLSPWISNALSAMPPVPSLLPMTVELAVYGAVAGALAHGLKWAALPSVVVAMVAGRALSLAMAAVFVEQLRVLFWVGLPGILIQVATLPFLSLAARRFLSRDAG